MVVDRAKAQTGKEAFVDGIAYQVADVRHGGMGVVYLLTRHVKADIEPPIYKSKLAAKAFNDAEDAQVRAVIKRELTNWLSLRHKNVLELLAIGDFNFELAALMPVAAASVADQIIQTGPVSLLAAVQILREAAAGLSFAWSTQRLLHLDVKPENMLLVRQDGRLVVKVSDWGMSSIQTNLAPRTLRGGTPPYMAPERFFRDERETCAWDIFSLGIALVGFVSGRLPFDFHEDIPDQLVSGAYLPRAASLLDSVGLHKSARRAALYLIHPDPQQRIGNYGDFGDAVLTIGRNPRFTLSLKKKKPWS